MSFKYGSFGLGVGSVISESAYADFPEIGERDKIYIDQSTYSVYIWSDINAEYIATSSINNSIFYVDTYSDMENLDTSSYVVGEMVNVRNNQGSWLLGTKKYSGIYIWNGTEFKPSGWNSDDLKAFITTQDDLRLRKTDDLSDLNSATTAVSNLGLNMVTDTDIDSLSGSGYKLWSIDKVKYAVNKFSILTVDGLEDTTVTSLANNQVLKYDESTSKWINTDLTVDDIVNMQTLLDGKVDENVAILAGTGTKITYDSKGLILSSSDATTSDILDSTDRRYVTDSELAIIDRTSGTNTGDQTAETIPNTPNGNISSTDVQSAINELDNEKEPADSTILKNANIGSTVQGYDENTVIDGSYVHTDNNYTSSDRNKLIGIEPGATSDQTDTEIVIAYNNIVNEATQSEAESGLSTEVRRWTPERIKQAIDAMSQGAIVNDTLDSTSTSEALSANQGRILNERISTGTNTTSWHALALVWDSEPTFNSNNGNGDIYDYISGGVTRYRFVPTIYNPAEDAFYEEVGLINKIVSRG